MKGEDFDVRGLRERLGMTRVELAAAIKAHPNAVARWERGEFKPMPAYADRLRALERRIERREGKSDAAA